MVAITQFLVAGFMTVAVQALPQPQAAQSLASSAAAPAATKNADAKAVNLASLSAIPRFQALLTEGGEGKKLLSGDDLKKQIVFPFTPPATPSAAKGGVAVAANIGTFPILTGLGISTTLGFVEPCGINTP
jgi:hypothetical protein